MQIITKDILTIDKGIICHQVNCQGVMGVGLAFDIKRKYPEVYKKYRQSCNEVDKSSELLGTNYNVSINDNLIICNMFAQDYYGRDKRYTDYVAFEECLKILLSSILCHNINKLVYFPYKIGCNNAGGDWDIISKLIEQYITEAIICKKD
jgi:hypothetical protein